MAATILFMEWFFIFPIMLRLFSSSAIMPKVQLEAKLMTGALYFRDMTSRRIFQTIASQFSVKF